MPATLLPSLYIRPVIGSVILWRIDSAKPTVVSFTVASMMCIDQTYWGSSVNFFDFKEILKLQLYAMVVVNGMTVAFALLSPADSITMPMLSCLSSDHMVAIQIHFRLFHVLVCKGKLTKVAKTSATTPCF